MRFLLTIITFILFIEFIDFTRLIKWAAINNIFTVATPVENADSEEKKTEETENKKIDKNFQHLYYSFNADINGSQTFYIKNTCFCPKGYDRIIHQPPKL